MNHTEQTIRDGVTTISRSTLEDLLLSPHGPVKLDALTAVSEDVHAGDLPGGVGLNHIRIITARTDAAGQLVVEWEAVVDLPEPD